MSRSYNPPETGEALQRLIKENQRILPSNNEIPKTFHNERTPPVWTTGGDFKWQEFLTTSYDFKFPQMPLSVGRNIYHLNYYLLQPLRQQLNSPITISSGWRPRKLNALVGGAKRSNHLTGEAADLQIRYTKPLEALRQILQTNLGPYYQLIVEKARTTEWLHVSLKRHNNPHNTRALMHFDASRDPKYHTLVS